MKSCNKSEIIFSSICNVYSKADATRRRQKRSSGYNYTIKAEFFIDGINLKS